MQQLLQPASRGPSVPQARHHHGHISLVIDVDLPHPAFQHRPARDAGQPRSIAADRSIKGIRGRESRLRHVEIFLIGSVVTPIIDRPLTATSLKESDQPVHTINSEEPGNQPVERGHESMTAPRFVSFEFSHPHREPDQRLSIRSGHLSDPRLAQHPEGIAQYHSLRYTSHPRRH